MATPRGSDTGGDQPEQPPRHYANHLAIEFSLSEVELRFGQHAADRPEPSIHSVVVSSPVHIVAFCQAIQATIDRYESRFGRIPDQTDPGTSETRQ